MRAIVVGLLVLGLTSLCNAQVFEENTLAEVEVYAVNYNYLKGVNSKNTPKIVAKLERSAANFDVKELILKEKNTRIKYQDNNGNYTAYFSNSSGKIDAVYDKEGKILKTNERFENIKLPITVINAISQRYPNWAITKDVYLVKYYHDKEILKNYKVLIEKNNKRIRVKLDENGKIL